VAASSSNGGATRGIAILVAAATVYDITAAINSSPQTTEINAKARAKTLMKWVNIGVVQSLLFVFLAAASDRSNRFVILWSGILASGLIYGQYLYAKACGLRSVEPGTEDYAAPAAAPMGRMR
jgi:hypothetical protein